MPQERPWTGGDRLPVILRLPAHRPDRPRPIIHPPSSPVVRKKPGSGLLQTAVGGIAVVAALLVGLWLAWPKAADRRLAEAVDAGEASRIASGLQPVPEVPSDAPSATSEPPRRVPTMPIVTMPRRESTAKASPTLDDRTGSRVAPASFAPNPSAPADEEVGQPRLRLPDDPEDRPSAWRRDEGHAPVDSDERPRGRRIAERRPPMDDSRLEPVEFTRPLELPGDQPEAGGSDLHHPAAERSRTPVRSRSWDIEAEESAPPEGSDEPAPSAGHEAPPRRGVKDYFPGLPDGQPSRTRKRKNLQDGSGRMPVSRTS